MEGQTKHALPISSRHVAHMFIKCRATERDKAAHWKLAGCINSAQPKETDCAEELKGASGVMHVDHFTTSRGCLCPAAAFKTSLLPPCVPPPPNDHTTVSHA